MNGEQIARNAVTGDRIRRTPSGSRLVDPVHENCSNPYSFSEGAREKYVSVIDGGLIMRRNLPGEDVYRRDPQFGVPDSVWRWTGSGFEYVERGTTAQ